MSPYVFYLFVYFIFLFCIIVNLINLRLRYCVVCILSTEIDELTTNIIATFWHILPIQHPCCYMTYISFLKS
jgi:hypothetical protein